MGALLRNSKNVNKAPVAMPIAKRARTWGAVYPGILADDDGEDDGAQSDGPQDEAGPIEAAGLGVGAFRDRPQGRREGDHPGGYVEPEDGRPTAQAHQDAAYHRSHGQGEAGDGSPDAQGPGPVAPFRIHVPQDGERTGLAGGRPDAHDAAGGDEHLGVGRQRPEDRPGHEDPHAGQHHLAPPQPVAQATEGQHETGEHECVGVDDPLEVGHGGVERLLQVVQRDAHDGRIEERQEEDAAERGQREAGRSGAAW